MAWQWQPSSLARWFPSRLMPHDRCRPFGATELWVWMQLVGPRGRRGAGPILGRPPAVVSTAHRDRVVPHGMTQPCCLIDPPCFRMIPVTYLACMTISCPLGDL